jgi:CubicO group peptidase (beta-lactamase class C family)
MPQIDQLEIDAKIDAILNRWPAVGLAVGVVRDRALEFSCHGIANIESAIPVTEDAVFRIGFITKTFTAVAVMQLWEQGLIDLDAPANNYLRAFRLLPAKEGLRPATTHRVWASRFGE